MPKTNEYNTAVEATFITKTEDGDWPHYVWRVALTRYGLAEKLVIPSYKMGLAHVQSKCGKPWNRSKPTGYGDSPCGHVRCANAGPVPTPPTLYDVICSLKADAPMGDSFADWCLNYGYDTDSRSALKMYLACQKSEEESKRFFGSDWGHIMQDEDYC